MSQLQARSQNVHTSEAYEAPASQPLAIVASSKLLDRYISLNEKGKKRSRKSIPKREPEPKEARVTGWGGSHEVGGSVLVLLKPCFNIPKLVDLTFLNLSTLLSR
jgi:hypothetical protein